MDEDQAALALFPGFESKRLTVDADVDIHYVTGGKGPPLLLIHGAPQSHIMWRRMAPLLRDRFTLIIPDLRGYGRSGKPWKGDYSKRRMAADMIAVMDALGHTHFSVAGHDRGARVTRRLVKDHADRIDRAVILDIVPTTWLYGHIHKKAQINLWNWALWAAPEPIAETVLNPEAMLKLMVRSIAPEPEVFDDYVRTNGNIESLHAMCEDYRAGAGIDSEHDAADAATKIATPLLVLCGTRSSSTLTVFDVEAAWRAEATDVRFGEVDCGHFLPEEAPEDTAAAMLDFLQ
ncbi:alpha/beta fold hydrolase [Sphingomonas montanisoli]|uniref:Alpha/beta hydrolase n=1 Tax=Sphingomonas montanisoli TaxID=2606412 RepID=A0A5D9C8T0_9SPHN|nr:alpha/beta hydrolase [Sphingomonas montanisoli]TZG27562.1 alpha/beta hydrolase [Sphingomonas montanisoli]